MLFYFVYMWRTLPPFQLRTVFWGPCFPLRTASLFTYGTWALFYCFTDIVNVQILSLKFFPENCAVAL